jgi:hypothetical protein
MAFFVAVYATSQWITRQWFLTAPSVRGQTRVILEALANAEVPAESISYIEAHGTGTVLGDAVELTALLKAFQSQTQKKHFCALGSVKTNVGNIGLALAEHLARDVQSRLVLVSRSPVPPREDWESWLQAHGNADRISQKITRLLKLEQLGADLFLAQADVANDEQIRVLLQHIDERWRRIYYLFYPSPIPCWRGSRSRKGEWRKPTRHLSS